MNLPYPETMYWTDYWQNKVEFWRKEKGRILHSSLVKVATSTMLPLLCLFLFRCLFLLFFLHVLLSLGAF